MKPSASLVPDRGRQAVYDAESAVFFETSLADSLGMTQLSQLAQQLSDHPWWRKLGLTPIRLVSSASRQRSYARGMSIHVAIGMDSPWTLAHEAAHVIVGQVAIGSKPTQPPVTHHGELFRRAYLDVLSVLCGQPTADRLFTRFVEDQLPPGDRAWAEPAAPAVAHRHGLYGQMVLRTSQEVIDEVAETSSRWAYRNADGAIPL